MKNKELLILTKIIVKKLKILKECQYKKYQKIAEEYLPKINCHVQGMKNGWWGDKIHNKLCLEVDILNVNNFIDNHVKKSFKEEYFSELEI